MREREDVYRTFIAIELPSEIRARIAQHIERLRRELPEVRASWLREDNLHLTLKFLGDVPVADIPKLSAATEGAAHAVDSFDLAISGCGSFPPHGQPKVLWIGIEDSPETQASSLHQLNAALEDECVRAGFTREERVFHPHLTIARFRSPRGSRRLAQAHKTFGFEPVSLSVKEVCVFRSVLSSQGSQHTVISRHKLR